MSVFNKADILLPKNVDMKKWSVVACDQYTSQPEYWERVSSFVGGAPSTLKIVYPEAFLSEGDKRISDINRTMNEYIEGGIFEEYKDSLIYVERSLSGGRVRRGIIGAIDLDEYDFNKGSESKIRATEGTVLERIPPRVKIRENAPLELPHVLILINDEKDEIFKSVKKGKTLYDFDLCENGGHIAGYLMDDNSADKIIALLDEYSENAIGNLPYAVGDGNHSLATAKTCWENLKKSLSEDERENHPARFCLVEIENIHDSALEFEPIHRAIFNVKAEEVIKALGEYYDICEEICDACQRIDMVYGDNEKSFYIKNPSSNLTVGTLQNFIDSMGYEVDYIHGADVTRELAKKENTVGFILPAPSKSDLFETVIADGALPRKTFSMGEANEKRFYLEAKKIK